MRSNAVARFDDRRVLELRRRPPEILLPGAKLSHDVKCLAVGHLRHVISAFGHESQHRVRAKAVDLAQVGSQERVERGPHIKRGSFGPFA